MLGWQVPRRQEFCRLLLPVALCGQTAGAHRAEELQWRLPPGLVQLRWRLGQFGAAAADGSRRLARHCRHGEAAQLEGRWSSAEGLARLHGFAPGSGAFPGTRLQWFGGASWRLKHSNSCERSTKQQFNHCDPPKIVRFSFAERCNAQVVLKASRARSSEALRACAASLGSQVGRWVGSCGKHQVQQSQAVGG